MKILGVDPGQKRIGIAVSDETASLARPLQVIAHVSRAADAAAIIRVAAEQGADAIVIGQSLDDEGRPTYQGRGADFLAETVRGVSGLTVLLWDEAFTTQDARAARIAQGAPRRKRAGHLDDAAAAVMLQSFLDQRGSGPWQVPLER